MLCEYGCGQEAKFQFKNGKWCCSKSKNKCPQIKKKFIHIVGIPIQNNENIFCDYGCGQKAKFQMSSEKWCCCKNYQSCPSLREKNSEKNLEVQNRPEMKEIYSKAQEEAWKDPIKRKNRIDARRGKKRSPCEKMKGENNPAKRPEVRKKIAETVKKNWIILSDERKEEILFKIFKSNEIKPNQTELFLDSKIQINRPKEFKYSGNGEVWIGGKNPDWININGKKQVIELFGDFWHGEEFRREDRKDFSSNKEHEIEVIEYYKKYGFDCLVIWEYELKNITLLKQKILDF